MRAERTLGYPAMEYAQLLGYPPLLRRATENSDAGGKGEYGAIEKNPKNALPARQIIDVQKTLESSLRNIPSSFRERSMTMSEKHIGLATFQIEAVSHVDPFLLAQGFQLIATEKTQSFRASFRDHWRAMFWSMILSVALIMGG